eukprot:50057_1
MSYLCNAYPEWMTMQNNDNHIPLYFAIANRNINAFYCLCRYMAENQMDVKIYFRERSFVQTMVDFGSELLEEGNVMMMKLLLSTFDYPEIFRFSSDPNTFDSAVTSNDVSLIKFVSQKPHKKMIDDILFDKCFVNKAYANEYALKDSTAKKKKAGAHEDEPDKKETDSEEDETKEQQDDDEEDDDENDDQKEPLEDTEDASLDWIELVYTTIVETFSALDLYTDILIMMQLMKSKNQWWSTWMLFLLTSPYLVSHGSLVVILQKKLSFNNAQKGCCSSFITSFFETLLMTPIALFYLFMIDLIFMVFSLISTVWLLLLILMTLICCKNVNVAAKYDSRDWIDKKVFEDFLRMNRTEVIGYRRLRTLSQLFFETIPQIVLQLRILWVIEWMGDNNTFQIDLQTLGWSIGLAISHLILEGGIIYLDKTAFQMSFMEYSLECLGGRVQWIPFQHLFDNIIENQIYIHRDNDRHAFDKDNFNAMHYAVDTRRLEDDNDVNDKKLLTLDYEDISAEMKCIKYCASYQFSSQTLNALTQLVINCPEMIIPIEFNLSTNAVLQNLFKQIMCKAQIQLGPNSFGNVDMLSFCDLYRASFNKANINIRSMDESTVSRLKYNAGDTKKMKDKIKGSLLHYGEIKALEWVKEIDIGTLKADILSNSTDSASNGIVRLDILRKCYLNRFYVGLNCENMKRINAVIEQCHENASQDNSWYFVIILLLLYSKGTVFGEHCDECAMDPSLKDILKDYIPTCIEISVSNKKNIYDVKIPFIVFEGCLEFRALYREHVEDILINKCKDFMISNNKMDLKRSVQKVTEFDLQKQFKKWNIFEEVQNKDDIRTGVEKLWYQLYKMDVQSWNIVFLDKLVFESKMYLHYNQYLHNTRAHREVSNRDHSVIQYNADEDEKSLSHFIPIDDLIPDFDMMERFQIYELNLAFTDISLFQVSFIPSISFIDEDANANNDIYLWKADSNSSQQEDLKDDNDIHINETNIGLSYYNYHLLHCDLDHVPKIEIVYSTSNVIVGDDDLAPLGRITAHYTTLFKEETEVKEPEKKQVLLLGLSNSGKTTLLYALKTGEAPKTVPTIGFNIETVNHNGMELNMWDVGGQDKLRDLWRHYYPGTDVIMFVVDAADHKLMDTAKEELHLLLNEKELENAAIAVIANKQDLPNALSKEEVARTLELDEIGKPNKCFETSAKENKGLTDALDWFTKSFSKTTTATAASLLKQQAKHKAELQKCVDFVMTKSNYKAIAKAGQFDKVREKLEDLDVRFKAIKSKLTSNDDVPNSDLSSIEEELVSCAAELDALKQKVTAIVTRPPEK